LGVDILQQIKATFWRRWFVWFSILFGFRVCN